LLAETKSPRILKKAKEIVIMGGAFFCSDNVTPHAKFNIWFNAESAQTVFDSRGEIFQQFPGRLEAAIHNRRAFVKARYPTSLRSRLSELHRQN
jgi:hypothetical protein